MITNLFSIFDPSSYLYSSGWLIILTTIFLIPLTVWKNKSSYRVVIKKLLTIFKKEIRYILGNSLKGTKAILITLFFSILFLNAVALYPYNFSTTAHLTVTLPLSLTAWSAIFAYGWRKNTSHMLSHLLPQGTPGPLINFIVLIELVRNLIRPLTLCVRLTANLVAGHLLMSLLGSAIVQLQAIPLVALSVAPLILTILESAVAVIQAYVFITLITLYSTEVT